MSFGKRGEGSAITELVELSIDEQGCIRLPLVLQHRLSLEPGMTLILEQGKEGEMWLRPKEVPPVLIDKGGTLVVQAEPLADLADVVRRERDFRAISLAARDDL